MNRNDNKAQITGLLIHASRILPHFAPDFKNADVLAFWLGQLGDLDFPALKKAVDTLLSSGRSFPTIGEIKDAAGVTIANPRVRAIAIAAQIRGILFSPGGRYDELDEVGKEVVRQCGGWSTLTGTDYEQLEFQVKNWQGLAEDIIAHPQKHVRFHEQLAGPAKNVVADLLAGKDPTRSLK